MGFDGDNETDFTENPDKSGKLFFHLNSTILPESALTVQSAAANIGEEECDRFVNLKCQNFGKKIIPRGKHPGLVVNAENSRFKPWSSDVGSNTRFT